MGSRKTPFVNGEFYHIYNRGVDKRNIYENHHDLNRFFQSMKEFNSLDPIGSLYELSFQKNAKLGGSTAKIAKLVNFVCYRLNPNHYHFILEQLVDGGISEFMKRLGGYTWFFNEKYRRSGALFQGRFKSAHIDSNEYLLHLSVYINLNNRVHRLGGSTAKLSKSSWEEYIGIGQESFCEKEIVLSQFKNKKEYKNFAESSLSEILIKKENEKEIQNLLLE